MSLLHLAAMPDEMHQRQAARVDQFIAIRKWH